MMRTMRDFRFFCFHCYNNIISCYLHKNLFPENLKTCTSWMNMENFEERKVTTWKIIVLKSCSILDFCSEYYITEIEKLDFHLPHVYILGKIIVQVNYMKCLWVDTISLTGNSHVIMQKYVRYSVNKFTHDTYLGVGPFLYW